jgi:hypothetical protein
VQSHFHADIRVALLELATNQEIVELEMDMGEIEDLEENMPRLQ